MRRNVLNMVKSCSTCANRAPSQKMEHPVVNTEHVALLKPMQEITVDYAEYAGKNFLIMVDRFSSCAFCEETKDKTIASTIKVMRLWFEHFGYPDRVRADNGPAFRSGFTDWLKGNKIIREMSSAYNSQSNGLAERAVKRCKDLIKKSMNEGKD